MNKTISLKYGAISGLIIVSSWFITHLAFGELNFDGGEAFGYATMLIALTAVFVGIKKRRDEVPESSFPFKNGFITGLGIVLVASAIYATGWLIYVESLAPDFVDKYEASQITKIEQSAGSSEEKTTQIEEMKSFNDMYRKPPIMAVFVFMEIFPIGLIVSIVSALILKRK